MATLMQCLTEVGDGRYWKLDSQTGVTLELHDGEPPLYTARMSRENSTDVQDSAESEWLEKLLRWLATNAPGITRDNFTAWQTVDYGE